MGIIMVVTRHPSPTFPGTDDSCDSLRASCCCPFGLQSGEAAAVGNWERSDGTMEELGSYCRDAARDVFVIETPGGGVMVFQKSGTV